MMLRRSLFMLALLCAGPACEALAQTDAIRISNGDQLTGEIKSLDRGLLRLKTEATDTIEIEWTHIGSLSSEQTFLVTLSDGRELLGSWSASAEPGVLRLATETGELALPIEMIFECRRSKTA